MRAVYVARFPPSPIAHAGLTSVHSLHSNPSTLSMMQSAVWTVEDGEDTGLGVGTGAGAGAGLGQGSASASASASGGPWSRPEHADHPGYPDHPDHQVRKHLQLPV